jgi:signal peptidase
MEDTIMTGDLIISKKVAEDEVKVGDVITFFDPATDGKSVVTHRIIEAVYDEKDPAKFLGYKTQGDNNETPELDLVEYKDIIGVWTETRIPLLGSILLFTQKPLGLIICIFIPIACFVGVELFARYKKDKASKNDIDALRAELEALKKEKENSENK